MEQDRRYLRTQMQKENIIQKLKERGCRITKQRLMLLDIILEEDCSCCKEIYYKASRLDDRIGTATVYRMVNTLEEIGAISRKNMYRITCDQDCEMENACTIEFDGRAPPRQRAVRGSRPARLPEKALPDVRRAGV